MNGRFKFVVITSSTCLVGLLLFGAVMGRSASPEDAYRHLAVYTEVLSRIKSEYVEEPDMKNVTLGAINGMLESIDPFASYLNPEQYKQYAKSMDSRKAGVGLLLSKKFGYVGVVEAIPGSAGAKAGLNTGDMIETIGGVATRDMPLAYAEMLLAGDAGTNVEVSVLRLRKPEPQKLTLTRAAIKFPAVTSKMLDGQVGFVHLPSMETGKTKEVAAALDALAKQGAKKLVLDLRNCAFGNPEDGIELANLFVEKGMLGYTLGQKASRRNYESDPAKVITKLPMVVLTNRGTATAAEVAAGALLENSRAEVVGERTYGDAAVRKAVTMEDGAAVILSVAKFYSPGGKALQDTGVMPSVLVADSEIPDTDDDDDTEPPQPQEENKNKEDDILKKALEVLAKGKEAVAGAAAAAPDAARRTDSGDMPPTTVKKDEKKN